MNWNSQVFIVELVLKFFKIQSYSSVSVLGYRYDVFLSLSTWIHINCFHLLKYFFFCFLPSFSKTSQVLNKKYKKKKKKEIG